MQHIDPAYWNRAREVLACERNMHDGSGPWSALRRLHADLARKTLSMRERLWNSEWVWHGITFGASTMRTFTDDGSIRGHTLIDDHADQVVLACVLALLGAVEGTDGLQERLAALWPS
jgi:hypothetical protein